MSDWPEGGSGGLLRGAAAGGRDGKGTQKEIGSTEKKSSTKIKKNANNDK